MAAILATTLDDLLDKLWDMRPQSRCIYEVQGMIAQRWHGNFQWYKWSDKDGGYIWTGSSRSLGERYTTKWTRMKAEPPEAEDD